MERPEWVVVCRNATVVGALVKRRVRAGLLPSERRSRTIDDVRGMLFPRRS